MESIEACIGVDHSPPYAHPGTGEGIETPSVIVYALALGGVPEGVGVVVELVAPDGRVLRDRSTVGPDGRATGAVGIDSYGSYAIRRIVIGGSARITPAELAGGIEVGPEEVPCSADALEPGVLLEAEVETVDEPAEETPAPVPEPAAPPPTAAPEPVASPPAAAAVSSTGEGGFPDWAWIAGGLFVAGTGMILIVRSRPRAAPALAAPVTHREREDTVWAPSLTEPAPDSSTPPPPEWVLERSKIGWPDWVLATHEVFVVGGADELAIPSDPLLTPGPRRGYWIDLAAREEPAITPAQAASFVEGTAELMDLPIDEIGATGGPPPTSEPDSLWTRSEGDWLLDTIQPPERRETLRPEVQRTVREVIRNQLAYVRGAPDRKLTGDDVREIYARNQIYFDGTAWRFRAPSSPGNPRPFHRPSLLLKRGWGDHRRDEDPLSTLPPHMRPAPQYIEYDEEEREYYSAQQIGGMEDDYYRHFADMSESLDLVLFLTHFLANLRAPDGGRHPAELGYDSATDDSDDVTSLG